MKKLAVILVVLIIGGGLYYYFSSRQDSARPAFSPEDMAIAVTRNTLRQEVEGSGRIAAARNVELNFALSGQVNSIHVASGDRVSQGAVLIELNNDQQELTLLRAENAYRIAEIEGIPNAIREAAVDRDIARADLERTKVKAPFDGIIAEVHVEEGASVNSSTVAVTLIDDSSFYAEVSIDEIDMAEVKLGQPAVIKVDALGNRTLAGEVADIGLIASSSGGVVTVPVRVEITEEVSGLKPGFSVSARIRIHQVRDVVTVPVEAINAVSGRSVVMVFENGQQSPVEVVTGMSDGREVEIVSGLAEGDLILPLNYGAGLRQGGSNPSMPGFPAGRMLR